MGFLWRAFAPRPLKKARRAMHPVRMTVRAVTPKPIKAARRATFGIVHPLEAVESAVADSIVRSRSRSRSSMQRPIRSLPRNVGREVYVYICPLCRKEFAHFSRDSTLKPHNDRFGGHCKSRKGKFKESAII